MSFNKIMILVIVISALFAGTLQFLSVSKGKKAREQAKRTQMKQYNYKKKNKK